MKTTAVQECCPKVGYEFKCSSQRVATEVAEGVKKAISNACNIFFIIFISFFIIIFHFHKL